MFAALTLARAGLEPLLLERGLDVEQRRLDVDRFRQTGALDPASNVQFGEGGAGAFSDGKLNTGIKDPRCRLVLEALAAAGGTRKASCGKPSLMWVPTGCGGLSKDCGRKSSVWAGRCASAGW